LRDPGAFLASECPLAGMHILQGMRILAKGETLPDRAVHPIELVARAYGLTGDPAQAGEAPQPQTQQPEALRAGSTA